MVFGYPVVDSGSIPSEAFLASLSGGCPPLAPVDRAGRVCRGRTSLKFWPRSGTFQTQRRRADSHSPTLCSQKRRVPGSNGFPTAGSTSAMKTDSSVSPPPGCPDYRRLRRFRARDLIPGIPKPEVLLDPDQFGQENQTLRSISERRVRGQSPFLSFLESRTSLRCPSTGRLASVLRSTAKERSRVGGRLPSLASGSRAPIPVIFFVIQ